MHFPKWFCKTLVTNTQHASTGIAPPWERKGASLFPLKTIKEAQYPRLHQDLQHRHSQYDLLRP